MVTRFRSSGPEGKPHSTKEGRSAEAQRAYMRKFGPQEPRRKRIWPKRAKKAEGGRTNLLEELGRVEGEPSNRNRRAEISRVHGELNKGYAKGRLVKGKQSLRDKLKRIKEPKWGRKGYKKGFYEMAGGSEKAKPHSTKEGRTASGKLRIKRILEGAHRPKPKTSRPKPLPSPGRPLRPKPSWPKREPMRPLRAKHGIGSLVKKIISKIKPKPKGKGLGSGVKPSEMKEIIPKKDRKLYLKEKLANPLPTHLRGPNPHREAKLRNKESKKAFKSAKGKASGGRIGLSHGGSAGAAIRGRGAEIK